MSAAKRAATGGRGGLGGLVVGVDGGATRTRYLLADAKGEPLARSEGRGSLLGAGEDEAVTDSLAGQIGRLVRGAGGHSPVDAVCAGLAGAAGLPHVARDLERRLTELGVARRTKVVGDAEVAFVDAFGDSGGILLIGGTGSVGLGRAGAERFERVGGWGALLGDEGSGYRIGLDGLRVAIRARDGCSPPTRLSQVLFEALALPSPAALLEWSQGVGKAAIAALAPLVIAAADAGDASASSIVDEAAGYFVDHATALRRRLGEGAGSTVALVGGLIEPGGPLHSRVTGALSAAGFTALERRVDGARGAVRMALDL